MKSLTGKPGARCGVCAHERRHQIEIGLVHGVAARVLGERFGLSHHSILRHSKAHLTPQIRAAIISAQKPSEIDLEALQASESEGLLAQLVAQRARLQAHGELALDLGDVRGCVAVEGAVTANLTLVAKLLGQLVQVHDVRHTSLLISPDYLKLRAALVQALRPFPDAARAVGAALHRLESDAAIDITAAASKGRAPPAPVLIEHEPSAPPCPVPSPC